MGPNSLMVVYEDPLGNVHSVRDPRQTEELVVLPEPRQSFGLGDFGILGDCIGISPRWRSKWK